MTPALTRRRFLETSGLTAAVLLGTGALGPSTASARQLPASTPDPFTLGVASGDPLPTGVVLWTRLAPDPAAPDGGMPATPVEVAWEVALDERFRRVVRRGTVVATPELGHSVHPEVRGLPPARDLYYRFRTGSAISPVGRTRTAPAPGARVDRLAFALASCQSWVGGRYAAYRAMAADDLDLVVHVGDYIYEGGATRTLADFRALHMQYKGSEDLRAAHAAFPFVTTFDDHEVDNNWAGDIPQDSTPDFVALRANAFQAYYEHLPLRIDARPSGASMRLYRRLGFGRLLDLHVLDTRQYRSDQVVGAFIAPRDPRASDPALTLTGDEQERWLFDGLGRSKARWNAVAQQTIMAQYDYDTGPGVSINHDQWDGYAAARDRFLDFVAARRPSNVVVLAGDWHSAWVNDLLRDFADPASEILATEFVGTSISSGCGWRDDVVRALGANPHVKFFDGDRRGYARCTVTPDEWCTEMRAVLAPADPTGPAFTLAGFAVTAGRPGARQVSGADGVSGRVTDGGVPVAAVTVTVRASGTVAGTGVTGPDGRYAVLVPPGSYDVEATAGSYRSFTGTASVAEGRPAALDIALTRVSGAVAGTGKRLTGSLAEGAATDLVLENAEVALTVSLGTQDGQLLGTTVGKVLDMTARGFADQLDWINLPYASATQPRGGSAWQQVTVRHSDVRVVEPGPSRAVVRATGASTAFPALAAVTDYVVEPSRSWIGAVTTFTNGGAAPLDVWIGDSLDHDGAGQRALVAGRSITTGPADYPAAEPWIGMTGTDPQVYGLLYDELPGPLGVYSAGIWIMSQIRVTIPAGASAVLRRRIAVAPTDGDASATLSRLWRTG